ncbi:MAG: thiaminase II, partial [Acidimicrobiales bacterium]
MTARPLPPGGGPFCDAAWTSVSRLVDAIVDHPFNRALATGDLDSETFTFYVIQDAHYLEGFSRALAAAAVCAPLPEETAMWSGAATEALLAERELHERWLAARGAPAGPSAGVAPTCLAYSSWLQAVALSSPYPVLA